MENENVTSYFSSKPGYMHIFNELLRDWEFKKNTLPALVKLVADADSGNEIKKTAPEYGAKKITFPKYKGPHYIFAYEGMNTNHPIRSLEDMCVEKVCQYAAMDESFRKEVCTLPEIFLQKLSQYPCFPGAAKFDVDKTDNSDEIGEKKTDYKKEACVLLEDAYSFINQPCMNANDIAIQKKIEAYMSQKTVAYNKKEIGALFNNIFNLYFYRNKERESYFYTKKIEKITYEWKKNEWKKKIFSHVLRVIFDKKIKPHDMLDEAITWLLYRENTTVSLLKDYRFWENWYWGFYGWIIDDSFQKYPLYAANALINFAATTTEIPLKAEALGIVELYYGLMQRIVDYNPLIIQNAAKDIHLLRTFLYYEAKFSSSIIHEAIKNDNIKALILLKERGDMDFCDRTFINTALKTKSLACLSFLFDKQKNMLSQDDKDHIWKMVCERCKNIDNIYDQKYYRALWHAKLNGDARPLEKFIIKHFTSADAIFQNEENDQKRQKIIDKVNQLYTSGYSYWNNETTQLKAINDINNVATTLLSAPLRLLQKDKSFLTSLLSMVQKTKVKMDNSKQLKDIKSDIKNVVADKKFILFCLNTIAFYITAAINDRDFTVPGLLVLGGFGVIAGIFLTSNYSKYCRIKRGIFLYERVNHLEGLLKGLQGEKEHNNLELQEKSLDIDISRAEVFKILSTFTLASMIGTHNGILAIGGLVAALYSLFKSGWEAFFKPNSYINNEDNARSKKLDELLASYLEQGKADGFARISNLKKQYKNKFLKKNNKQNKNTIDNNLFFQLLQYGKSMQERKFKLLEKFDYFESNYAETYQKLIKHHQEL